MPSTISPAPKPAIQVRASRPSESLKHLVHCYFWTQISSSENEDLSSIVARVLPHAASDILVCEKEPIDVAFHGSNSRLEGAMLSGPFLSTPTYRASGQVSIFGIRLKHGALGRVVPFSAKRMVNTLLPLEEVWGKEKCENGLTNPVSKAETFEDKVAVAEKAIQACLADAKKEDPKLDKAVKTILESKGRIGVTELAGKMGVSRQTLKSKFDQAVGFAPKLFGRLLRFQNTLKVLYQKDQASWSDLAQECGYYDQAHLIREFNHFTGFSPERLLRDISRGDSIYYFDQAEQTLSLMKDKASNN